MFKDEVSLSAQDVSAINYALKSSAVYEGDSYELWNGHHEGGKQRALAEIRRQARAAERLTSQWIGKRAGNLQARSVCESFRAGRKQRMWKPV